MKLMGKIRTMLASVMLTILFCMPVLAATENQVNVTGESYRIVKIYNLDGAVTVKDKDGKEKPAYKGMNLASGDTVRTGKNSHVYLQMDNDKYVMADAHTQFKLEVSGTARDSKTTITLLNGSIINRVDEKLNNNSSYEVKASNVTMAIRGTVAGNKVSSGPDGSASVLASVYEGDAELLVSKKYSTAADSNNEPLAINTDKIQLAAGESLNVSSTLKYNLSDINEANADDALAVSTEKVNIDLSGESAAGLQFVRDSADTGRELFITVDAIEQVIQQKKNGSSTSVSSGSSGSNKSTVNTDAATNDEPELLGTAENLPDDDEMWEFDYEGQGDDPQDEGDPATDSQSTPSQGTQSQSTPSEEDIGDPTATGSQDTGDPTATNSESTPSEIDKEHDVGGQQESEEAALIADRSYWFNNNLCKEAFSEDGGIDYLRSTISEIHFAKSGDYSIPEHGISWDASYDRDGSVMACVEKTDRGMELTLVGNSKGIKLPEDATNMFRGFTALTTIDGMDALDTTGISSLSCMFAGDSALTSINLSTWNINQANDLSYMFYGCSDLASVTFPAESGQSDNVENMRSMFYECTSLRKVDFNALNTSNVTSMRNLFFGCTSLAEIMQREGTSTEPNINTNSVTDMAGMFCNCSGSEFFVLTELNTSSVQDMSYMFAGTGFVKIDLSHFNTGSVTNMRCMFMNAKAKEIDINGINAGNVTDMSFMFYNCANLVEIIDEANFDYSKVTNDTNMFAKCNKLRGERGTTYTTSHAGKEYARLDQSIRGGYFSKFDS